MKYVISLKHFMPLFVLFSVSANALAEECYDVSGKVKTKNEYIPDNNGIPFQTGAQLGKFKLILKDDNGEIEFIERAKITGNIAGFNGMNLLLNHTIVFPNGDQINTIHDEAQVTGIRAVDFSGAPCSFFVTETVNNATGTGEFSEITYINLTVQGYTSFCLDENYTIIENQNLFKDVSGTLCFDD